jgi:chaperonin GroEL
MQNRISKIARLTHVNSSSFAKELLFGNEARNKMLEGCDALADAVQVTLGPNGRNVLIDQGFGPVKITKDGVTVAKAIEFSDRFANMGASLVKSVANKTNDEAGDGTTTATVLARAIFKEALKKVEVGVNLVEMKKGIDMAVVSIVEELKKVAIPVESKEQIKSVATISANGD